MAMLLETEVQRLAVYYQNRDRINQETALEQARWENGGDWLQRPEHGDRIGTPWLQLGTHDYVKRRIAETVRDAALAIEQGHYENPGLHVAIMNTRDCRHPGLHWVVVMYEIQGPGDEGTVS
jgi:hypothetical protein